MSRFDSITMTHHYDSSLWLSRGSYSMLNQTIAFQSHGCIPKLYFFSKYMSTDSAPFHSLLMCQHFGALRLMVSYLVLRRPIRSRAPLARGFRLALGHPWRTRATPSRRGMGWKACWLRSDWSSLHPSAPSRRQRKHPSCLQAVQESGPQ